MNTQEPLHQQLLELAYDLLPEDQATALRKRIESEPEIAQAFEQVQKDVELLATAARLERPPVALEVPNKTTAPNHSVSGDQPMNAAQTSKASTWTRVVHWTAAIAASVLLLIAASQFYLGRAERNSLADRHVRLAVTGPSKLLSGVDQQFSVTTTDVEGRPMSAEVQYALYGPNNQQIMGESVRTDESGNHTVIVPADLKLPPSARLEVLTVRGDHLRRIDLPVVTETERFATYLSTDKPLYQPGEKVYFRSLTTSRVAFSTQREMPIRFEIRDPSGAVVANSKSEGMTKRGVGNGMFELGAHLAGGEYTLVASSVDESFPEEQKAFFVRRYRLPRLKKELEFARDSYTPGDEVVADFLAERAEGGAASKASLTIKAAVDEVVVFNQNVTADEEGALQVRFTLPKSIEKGEGQLIVVVDDGGNRETIAKTIPINLGKVDVQFFPEGGDLVPGVENRLYFTARDPIGDPVHIEGKILDAKGKEVATLETGHEGMGRFALTPNENEKYTLKITSPADVSSEPVLPLASKSQTVTLSTGDGVFKAGKPLQATVQTTSDDHSLLLAAYCRGAQVGLQQVPKSEGSHTISMPLAEEAEGVLRLTLFDYSTGTAQPVAERLVFRRVSRQLRVHSGDASERYSPGQSVELSLMVTDESGRPTPAVLGVAVVDDALLSLADDKSPRMRTHFLLTTEVQNPEDLEDANFFLSKDPDAPAALDLLLGTQGWRRFAETTVAQLQSEGRTDEEINRLAALGGIAPAPTQTDTLPIVEAEYATALASLERQQSASRGTLGLVLVASGSVLGLILLLMALLRRGGRAWAPLPALGAATACLVMGAIWVGQSMPDGGIAELDQMVASAVGVESVDNIDLKYQDEASAPEDAVEDDEEARPELSAAGGEGPPLPGEALPRPVAMPAPAEKPALEAEEAERDLRREDFKKREAGKDLELDDLDDEAFPGRRARQLFGNRDKLQKAKLNDLAPMSRIRWLRQELGQASKEGKLDELKELTRQLADVIESQRFAIRQYAHQHQAGQPGVRSDFTETLYWNPLLIADADGRATIKFDLSDSVTTFRVLADAHSDEGRIGSGGGQVVSRIPFSLEPKLPLEVNAGDRIELPLAVINDTRDTLPVELAIEHSDLFKLDGGVSRNLELGAEQRLREYFTLAVVGQKGDAKLQFRGLAGTLADAIEKTIKVVPPGFPVAESYSGRIEGTQELSVKLPERWVPGSLEVTLQAFPTSLADLQSGMAGIIREPSGCFEQTSTSNYPNVMAMQYMQENRISDPSLTRRTRDLLKKGYGRLTGYECSEKGYEWFGSDPGHEALTAYGLLQFRDMAQVYDVDEEMITRTANWLLKRRDGKGSYKRNARALDSFGRATPEVTDAYVTWALSESGQKGIEKELEHVIALGNKSEDPYLIALAASSAVNAGDKPAAEKLLKKLGELQKDDGHLEGTQGSITRSGGLSLKVETTALAALAWLKVPAYRESANKAIEWITSSRQGSGGFGSTQATILALKALVQHAKEGTATVTGGNLVLLRDGKEISQLKFSAGQRDTIKLEGIEASLEAGENELSISLSGDNKMPYALDISYRTAKPNSDDACPLRLTTKLASDKVKAGETVTLTANLENTSEQGQPMTMAILGVPAGLSARTEQLEELKEAGTIDYYETRAREVICYWRDMAPKRTVDVKLDLIAEVPGEYTGPASRTYLYYTAEQKQWTEPLKVEITRE